MENRKVVCVSDRSKSQLDDIVTLYDNGEVHFYFDKSPTELNRHEVVLADNLLDQVKNRLLLDAPEGEKDLVRTILKIEL